MVPNTHTQESQASRPYPEAFFAGPAIIIGRHVWRSARAKCSLNLNDLLSPRQLPRVQKVIRPGPLLSTHDSVLTFAPLRSPAGPHDEKASSE